MAEEVEFGQVGGKKPRKNTFLYSPKHMESIRVRFVGKQQNIYTKWDKDAALKPTMTYHEKQIPDSHIGIISFVIDRSDAQVKAYKCPASVWRQMGQVGAPNHDFQITRMGFGIKTRYEAVSMGESLVGDELMQSIEVTQEVYPLIDIFMNNIAWELLEVEPEPIDCRFDILDL